MKQHTNYSIKKNLILLFFLTIFLQIECNAQTTDKNIELGKIITLNSKVLNEDRDIFVYLPVGYKQSQEKYPVIYILDGRGNFTFAMAISNFLSRIQRMPRSIVVGIPNTDRTRDFTPTHVQESKTSGGADKFLDFMKEELIPYIDNNYRTESYRTLFGHSLCGMFAIYTLFEKPEMFNSFIAVSPYLQYDNQYVVNRVDSIITEQKNLNKCLYITIGDEPEYMESITRLEEILSSGTESLYWKTSKREGENHASIPLKSFYDGLEFIYSGWQLSNEIIEKGLEAVKKHYSNLSDKYGFEVKPTEVVINALGYQYLGKGENEKALWFFKYNIKLYPNSANVYDSCGEAMEKSGMKDLALENYKMAVKLGSLNNDGNLNIFKQNLERVESSN
ncbi:MAG: hypothetical protein KKF62_15215 [Bacteroidetes bacterium]|nr:hypothetical protein [Bacteroidota bacterium]MBU1113808.1 hypothetical protein [Bacteroidota bacterium]MBU1799606.1 hypothetical protein [Bacteroidota bacterium]